MATNLVVRTTEILAGLAVYYIVDKLSTQSYPSMQAKDLMNGIQGGRDRSRDREEESVSERFGFEIFYLY